MELHYSIATILFIVLVLVVCFVAVSMFIPLYWNARGSPLFNTTTRVVYSTHNLQTSTITSTTTSSETHSTHNTHVVTTTTTTLLTTPPPGELKVYAYHIYSSEGYIFVDLVFINKYPRDVFIEEICLNNTRVFKGSYIIRPWSLIKSVIDDDRLAYAMVAVTINTHLKPSKSSSITIGGKMVPVGNLTIYYRIEGVIGKYKIRTTLELPECMIKECNVFP